MNTRKIFSTILVSILTMTTLFFTSCSDDDSDSNTNDALIGTWRSVASEMWEYEDGELVYHIKESGTSGRIYTIVNGKETGEYRDVILDQQWEEITFRKDGSWYNTNEDADESSGTYSVSNNQMKVFVSGMLVSTLKYEINGNQLIMTMDEKNEDDGLEEHVITTYEKK